MGGHGRETNRETAEQIPYFLHGKKRKRGVCLYFPSSEVEETNRVNALFSASPENLQVSFRLDRGPLFWKISAEHITMRSQLKLQSKPIDYIYLALDMVD